MPHCPAWCQTVLAQLKSQGSKLKRWKYSAIFNCFAQKLTKNWKVNPGLKLDNTRSWENRPSQSHGENMRFKRGWMYKVNMLNSRGDEKQHSVLEGYDMKIQGQKLWKGMKIQGWQFSLKGMNVQYCKISFGKGMKMKEGAFLSHKGKMPLDGVDSWCIFAPLESYFSKIRVAFTPGQLCWIRCIGQTCLNIQWPPKFAYLHIMTSFKPSNLYFSPWNSFQLGWISSFRFLHIA